jgi:hypothetical protein
MDGDQLIRFYQKGDLIAQFGYGGVVEMWLHRVGPKDDEGVGPVLFQLGQVPVLQSIVEQVDVHLIRLSQLEQVLGFGFFDVQPVKFSKGFFVLSHV